MNELDQFLEQFYSKYSPNEIPQGERRERLKQKLSSDFDGYVTQMYQKYAPDNIPDSTRLANLRSKYLPQVAPQETEVQREVLTSLGSVMGVPEAASNLAFSTYKGAENVIINELPKAFLGYFQRQVSKLQDVEGLTPEQRERISGDLQGYENYIKSQETSAQKDLSGMPQSYTEIETVNDFANYVGGLLGQSAGQIIPSLLSGGASSYLQESQAVYRGQLERLAKENNISTDEVIARNLDDPAAGQAYAIAATGLDVLSNFGLTKPLAGFKGWLRKTFTEAITEPTQGVLEDIGAGYGSEEVLSSKRIDEAFGGVLGGGVLSGVTGTSEARAAVNTTTDIAKETVASGNPAVDSEIDNFTSSIINEITDEKTETGNRETIPTTEGQTLTPEGSNESSSPSSIDRPQEVRSEEVQPTIQEGQVEQSIEETKGLELTPIEAAERFQGFITGTGEEAISQIADYAEGKFKKRSEFEQFIEAYNERNERKIYDSEANKVWEQIREMKPRIKDTSPKIKITEMGGLKKQIKDFARGIREGRKDAKTATKELTTQITEKLGKSDVPPTVVSRIIKRIGNVNLLNPLKVQELIRYTDRVAQDATYAEKLDRASELQSRIKKASKNPVFASFKPSLQKLGRLNLNNLEKIQSIDDYIEKAEGYLGVTKDVKSPKYSPTDLKAFAEYADNAFVEAKLVGDELAREALGMEGDLTKEELEYLFSEDDEFYENALDTERKILDDKLRTIASYSKMGLEDVEGVEDIKAIDINDLTGAQLKQYIKVVDNIVLNGDLSNSGILVAISKAINGAKTLKSKLGNKLARRLRDVEATGYNLPNITKGLWGTTQLSGLFRNYTGINDFFGRASKVKTLKERKAEEFSELVKKVNKQYKTDVNSRENVARKGIIEYLHGYDQGTDRNATFLKKKANLERSFAQHAIVDPEQAAFEEALYQDFKNATTIDDVNSIAKTKYPAIAEMVEFDRKMFEEYKYLQHEANVRDDNRYAPIVEEYFPTKIKQLQAVQEVPKNLPIGLRDPSSSYGRNYNLGPSQIIDLSSNINNFNSYQEMLEDIYVNPEIMRIKEFFKLKDAVDMMGSQENLNKFYKVLEYDMKKELGDISISTDELGRTFAQIGEILRKAGALKVLGSPLQAIKQRVVMVNTIARLGNKSGYLMTSPTTAPIYSEFTIGQRGSRLGGIDAGDAINIGVKSEISRKLYDKLGEFRLGMEKYVWEPIGSFLIKGDVWSAKRSWGAFFQKYLKENYNMDIDLMTAHEQLQDPRIQEAASYAEQMVGETQIASSAGEGANLLYSGDSLAKKMLLGAVLPFSNFAFNMKARMGNIIKMGLFGSKSEKIEAASALVGLTAEVMVYYYVAQGIKDLVVYTVDQGLLEAMFGLERPDEDEEDKEIYTKQMMMSSFFRDLWPLALEQNITDAQLTYINGLITAGLKEEGYTQEEIDKRKWFYVRSHKSNTEKFGIYGIVFSDIIGEPVEVDYENDMLIVKNNYGTTTEVPIDNNLENFLVFASVVNYFAAVGIGFSDFTQAVNRVKKQQIRQAIKLNQEQ